MPGSLCVGQPTNNAGAGLLSESKAHCEGVTWRMGGTALERPASANPHLENSPDYEAWQNGWDNVNDAAGGTLPAVESKCCAVDRTLVISA